MAKAIYGHLGADRALAAEVARWRARVRELEEQVRRVRESASPGVADAVPAPDFADIERLLADDLLVPDPR